MLEVMSYERLYIHGIWDFSGFLHAFPPADKGQEIDERVVKRFDMIKGHSELFKVERRDSRFYYSYVRYKLISATDTIGQVYHLGFTYVFDEGSKAYVLNDLLGLRQILKQATDSLLDGNRIIITSDEDDRVAMTMQHIRQYIEKATATKVIKATNANGEKTIALDDATNEKIFAALEKTQTVIVSPYILTEAQRLAEVNQGFRKRLEEQYKEIECLKQEKEELKIKVDEATKHFSGQLKKEFAKGLQILVENFQDLFGINSHPDETNTKHSRFSLFKLIILLFNTVMLSIIFISVNKNKNDNSASISEMRNTIEELRMILQHEKAMERLNNQIESTKDKYDTIKIVKPPTRIGKRRMVLQQRNNTINNQNGMNHEY